MSKNLTSKIGGETAMSSGIVKSSVRYELTEVYAHHFRYVWRCLKSLGVPEGQLDDAVQEVFLVVHRKLEDFDGNNEVTTWLYAIAVRIARRAHRSLSLERSRLISIPQDASLENQLHTTGQAAEKGTLLSLAHRVLLSMDETKREVFVLSMIEGLSAPEIAPILGVPLNTVYSRIRAAKRSFSDQLAEIEHSSPDLRTTES